MRRFVVIGGGVAGLAAALRLSATEGHAVTVLEAAPEFGGRVRSFIDRHSGQELDNGQHVLMGACTAALAYLDVCGAHDRIARLRGLSLPFHHRDGRRARLQSGRLVHPLSLLQAFLRYDMLSRAARLRTLRVAIRLRAMNSRQRRALDARSAEEWLRGCGQRDEEIALFWVPLILATMNSTPRAASAMLFATLLREIFLGRPDAADMLLPTSTLSAVFIRPAVAELVRRGARVRTRAAVTSVDVRHAEGRSAVTGVRCGDERIEADAVISAVPPWAFTRMLLTHTGAADAPQGRSRLADHVLPGTDLSAFVPSEILSVHVWLRQQHTTAPMTGLLGTTVQWVFEKEKSEQGFFQYSCTVSAAEGGETTDPRRLRESVLEGLRCAMPGLAADDIVRILPVREKRATFVPRPGLDALRPTAMTPISGLALAGDWTATGLPATIEGAIRSGFAAAHTLTDEGTGW